MYCIITGKKSDINGNESFIPTLFQHTTPARFAPRQSRTSLAAGSVPTPKTWYHITHRRNHHFGYSVTGQRSKSTLRTIGDKRPEVPPILRNCGHDYVRTVMDPTPCTTETVSIMTELVGLRNEVQYLRSRILSVENVKFNTNLFKFYTNLPNYEVFSALCDYLNQRSCMEGSCLRRWKGGKTSFLKHVPFTAKGIRKPGPDKKLSFENEFFLVLMKLKTGRHNEDLANHFEISIGLVSEILTTWLCFMEVELKLLFEMPDKCDSTDGVPHVFRDMSGLRAIIDCTELMLQKASDLQERKATFSNYKHHDTVKFMVGLSPQLCINYVSKAWGGRTSDKHITLQSKGFIDGLVPGMQVMADRGFTVSNELRQMGVALVLPSFKGRGRPQMTAEECAKSENIAKGRIHIERAIQRIRTFNILATVVRLNMMDIIEQIFTVCAYLTNFQLPIVR